MPNNATFGKLSHGFKPLQLRPNVLFNSHSIIYCMGIFFMVLELNAQPDPTFKKTLISVKEMIPLSIEAAPNGGFIVGGIERTTNAREGVGFIVKLTEQGDPEWTRTITSDSAGSFQQVKPTKDGGFIGVNNYLTDRAANGSFTANALTWCKTDASGTVQWAKTIREGTKNQGIPAIDMEVGEDGAIYTVGAFGWGAISRTVINKINPQGNQTIKPSNFYIDNDFEINDLMIAPNKDLVVVGSTNSSNISRLYRGALVRVMEEAGALITKPTKVYISNNFDINFKKSFNTADGGLLVVGIAVPDKHLLVKLDKLGNVEWGKVCATGLINYTPKEILKTSDNSIILMGYTADKTILMKVDISGNLLWSRNINAQGLSISLLAETPTGNFMAVGNGYRFQNPTLPGLDFYITLIDKNGYPNNCTYANANISIENHTIIAQPMNSNYFTHPISSYRDNTIESGLKPIQSNLLCKCLTVKYLDTAVCNGNTIKIANKSYNNSAKDTFLTKNAYGCDSVLFVKVTLAFPISRKIDTTICKGDSYTYGVQQLTQSGTYPLALKTKAGCDSMITLNLTVKDTTTKYVTAKICEGDTYTLFNKKLTKSGVYADKIKLSSGCDSTVVLSLFVTPKAISPDIREQLVTITEGDTLPLNPCVKGIRYDWTPVQNLSCSTCDTPTVFSKGNILIKAKITLETGCLSECTYQINVVPKIDKPKPFDVPTAFSPNGDGINDVFQVRCTKIKMLSLEIYNRWGALMLQQLGENAEWDGRYKGQLMVNDVFAYIIRYINLETQKEEVTYGDVTLMR